MKTMQRIALSWLVGTAGVLAMGSFAQAHVVLEQGTVPVGSYYKAVLEVPHGCKGSNTIALKVRIPEGVIRVKPKPKPGWNIKLTDGQYQQSYTLYGAKINKGVKIISWTGGNLPDNYYDEFTFLAYITDSLKPGTQLYFPVVQTCEKGAERWIDTSGTEDSPNPAPSVKLVKAQISKDG